MPTGSIVRIVAVLITVAMSAAITPALMPPAPARLITYSISTPGVKFSNKPAMINKIQSCMPSMDETRP